MLHHKSRLVEFWDDAISTVTYVNSRVTNIRILEDDKPYQTWNGKKPNLADLKVLLANASIEFPLRNLNPLTGAPMQVLFLDTPAIRKRIVRGISESLNLLFLVM